MIQESAGEMDFMIDATGNMLSGLENEIVQEEIELE